MAVSAWAAFSAVDCTLAVNSSSAAAVCSSVAAWVSVRFDMSWAIELNSVAPLSIDWAVRRIISIVSDRVRTTALKFSRRSW
jgi:hypothetical protein